MLGSAACLGITGTYSGMGGNTVQGCAIANDPSTGTGNAAADNI